MVADAHGDERLSNFVFAVGRMYLQLGRRKQLLRFLAHDELHDELLFKLVAPKWDNMEKNAIAIRRLDALRLADLGKLVEMEDYVRPSYLSDSDEKLKEWSRKSTNGAQQWMDARDVAYERIKWIVEPEGTSGDRNALLAAAYSPRTTRAVVNQRAEELGVKPLVIKRLLHKYAWFGLAKNALLNLDPFKGRTALFSKKYESKPGPKNSAEKVFGPKYRGRPRKRKDLTIFLIALTDYYVAMHMTLKDTFDAMVSTHYRQRNQSGSYAIRGSCVPTFRQFEQAARHLCRVYDLKAKRAGHKDGKEMVERTGHDTDLAPAVGDVYDMDGTPFNKELVSVFKIDGKQFNIRKATLIVVFDRRSKKAVGWHIFIGDEDWKEGYRLALFCALTSKVPRLKWLGMDSPEALATWPDQENIVPEFVYVDGGPGASKTAREAFDALEIDFYKAAPDTPYWKPSVEGGQKILQEAQAYDGGGYKRTSTAVDRDAKRKATLFAKDTVQDLERKLVAKLVSYNMTLRPKMRMPAEARVDGAHASPHGLFSWGVSKLGGVRKRLLHQADIYERLLSRGEWTATKDGIHAFRGTYQSERLRAYRHVMGKNIRVAVLYHPLRPDEVYWRTPDGVLDPLTRTMDSLREYGKATLVELEEYTQHMSAIAIVQRHKSRPANVLSVRQRKLILNADPEVPRKPIQQRKATTKDTAATRKLDKALHQSTRPFDRPECLAPELVQATPLAAFVASVKGGVSASPACMAEPSTTEVLSPVAVLAPVEKQESRPGRKSTADMFLERRNRGGNAPR